jgi:hypothetical protein
VTRGLNKAGRSGTEIFPETAKELARRVGLTEQIFILTATQKDDGGGNYELEYVKQGQSVRARVDSYKRQKPKGIVASQINEFTDHIFTIDRPAVITPIDRLERPDGSVWELLAVNDRTDQATIQVLAKKVDE